MQLPAILRAFVAPLSLLLVTASAAELDLRYKFQPGITNGYRVTIESASENNPRRFEGIILVGVRSVEDDVATVFFRGRLQPKQNPNAPQHFPGPMFHPGHFGNQHDPFQQLFRMSMLPQVNEAQIDPVGRVLRTAGLIDLPRPLENFASLLFPILPANGQETATDSNIVLDEEPAARDPHMHGFHPAMRGNAPGRLTGTLKQISRKLDPTNGLPRFSHESNFRSLVKTDDQPRLAMKSKAEFVLDPSTGQIQNLKLEGNSTISNLDLLRKLALVVTVEKVGGDELARAISDAAERVPNLSGDNVDALLADLKAEDQTKRNEAVQRLLSANLDQHAKRLLPVVLPFLNENDHSLKMLATRILAQAATEEHLPLLYRLLKQEDMGHQHEIIRALGRIAHKDSIQPLSDMIAYGNNNAHSAADALAEFGSAAEPAALELLKEKHLETRRQACRILQKAGTSKSLEPLQAVIAAADQQLIHEATEALRQIRERGDAAAKLIF